MEMQPQMIKKMDAWIKYHRNYFFLDI